MLKIFQPKNLSYNRILSNFYPVTSSFISNLFLVFLSLDWLLIYAYLLKSICRVDNNSNYFCAELIEILFHAKLLLFLFIFSYICFKFTINFNQSRYRYAVLLSCLLFLKPNQYSNINLLLLIIINSKYFNKVFFCNLFLHNTCLYSLLRNRLIFPHISLFTSAIASRSDSFIITTLKCLVFNTIFIL